MEKSELVIEYTNYILEEGKKPLNVFKFCKSLNIEESEFYEFFNSFEAIEKHIFKHFYHETQKVLNSNEEFKEFNSKDKLLSFYYTFIENLTSNRSLVLYLLDSKNPIKGLVNIHSIKSEFKSFVDSLDLKQIEIPVDQLKQFQNKGMGEIVWGHFLSIIKYWLKDGSSSFEKTDVFIEKSTSVGFELLNFTQLENVVDLGKFLFKDAFKMN